MFDLLLPLQHYRTTPPPVTYIHVTSIDVLDCIKASGAVLLKMHSISLRDSCREPIRALTSMNMSLWAEAPAAQLLHTQADINNNHLLMRLWGCSCRLHVWVCINTRVILLYMSTSRSAELRCTKCRGKCGRMRALWGGGLDCGESDYRENKRTRIRDSEGRRCRQRKEEGEEGNDCKWTRQGRREQRWDSEMNRMKQVIRKKKKKWQMQIEGKVRRKGSKRKKVHWGCNRTKDSRGRITKGEESITELITLI